MVIVSLQVFAQNYPVSTVNISLPSTPDANTANWGRGKSPLVITASAQTDAIKSNPSFRDSRILVIIKSDGNKICGKYDGSSAPAANFTTNDKTWRGNSAVGLLGQACILPPGNYEISVQFFGDHNGKTIPLSNEKIKSFTIEASLPAESAQKPGDAGVASDAQNNKPGFAVSVGGLGNIVFGGAKKKVIYCGKITSATRIRCAGNNPQTGAPSFYITMVITNSPVDRVKSCDFMVNAITPEKQGDISSTTEKLPLTIAANASVTYSFKYTPLNLRDDSAKFSIRGTWNGDARNPLELEPELKLPPCVTCDCGSWSPLAVNQSLKFEYGDKNIISWKCNQPFSFNTIYKCAASGQPCDASTSWEIAKDGVSIKTGEGTNDIVDTFTPAANGTYTITLNASCNGIKCPPSVYTIAVEDCKTCDCGAWSPLAVNNAVKFENAVKNTIAWKCGQPFSFTSVYQCGQNSQGCQATTTWQIAKDGVSIKTGSGNGEAADSFTPTGNGTYIIALNAACNGIKCPPAVYTVVVEDCTTCDCGNWISPLVNIRANDSAVSTLKCGESATVSKGSYSITVPDFNCIPKDTSCAVSYSWSVRGGPVAVNGTRKTFVYNFERAGIYTIEITPVCGGKKCTVCKFQLIVDDSMIRVNAEKSEPKKQLATLQHWYYVIRPEYSGEIVYAKDTLFLQVENNYSSGSNQLTYTIRNLSNDKSSRPAKLPVASSQGLIRVALPLQNSVVQSGETGMLIMNDFKKYYYISFKRN